jgi:predicted AlkP superfamily pyrophosphatase or phosphodiesterase
MKKIQVLILILGSIGWSCTSNSEEKPELKTVVIIVDALRYDYVNEENTPNIYAMIKEGSFGLNHHSTFPTVTRVNSTSYATGSYPKTHGILGNSIFLPKVDPLKGLNTGDASVMMMADSVENGKLLSSLSIGEVLQSSGKGNYAVFSTGSTGQSFLLNHKIKGSGIINPDMILPENLHEKVINEIGEIPPRSKPNKERHHWVTDAFIKYALVDDLVDVATIWYSDPDGTAHGEGIGAPMTMESIRNVDEQIGRIISSISELGMENRVNLIVSADHGFATHKGNPGIASHLVERGLKESKESDDIIVVGNAVYLNKESKENASDIIKSLVSEDWVGAVFVNSSLNLNDDLMEKLFPLETFNWNHPQRAADFYVDVNWTEETNAFGYAGYSYNNGTAGHGSSSPFEMKTPFIAKGPSFLKGFENELPSGMVDIVPTVLHIHGVMDNSFNPDGRILNEILVGSTEKEENELTTETHVKTVALDWGEYELNVTYSTIGEWKYLDHTKTIRKRKE